MSSINDMIRQLFADEYHISINNKIEEISSDTHAEFIENNQENSQLSYTEKIAHQDTPTMNNFIISKPTHPDLLALYKTCLSCQQCSLCDSASQLVFGEGDAQAKLMIIGEAPGADEDEQGRPFVGRAGQLLIKTLKKYGVEREQVYIANILKHRPPNNRNPLPTEIEVCTPFLRKQLEIIKPKLLLTLGNFASQFILETKTGITKIRGSIQESSFGMVMPTLHPSAIIRGAYPLQLFEDDIIKALTFVGYAITNIEE
ncbi:MAG: uracil-DNA glycosylase [Brevinema sp.]